MRHFSLIVAVLSLGALASASACATSPDEELLGVPVPETQSGAPEEGGVKLPPPSQPPAEDSGPPPAKDASPPPVDAAKPDTGSSSGSSGASSSSSSSSSGSTPTACDVSDPLKEAYYLAQVVSGNAQGLCPCAVTQCCYTLVCVTR